MAPVAHIALKMSTVQPYGSRNTPSGPQKVIASSGPSLPQGYLPTHNITTGRRQCPFVLPTTYPIGCTDNVCHGSIMEKHGTPCGDVDLTPEEVTSEAVEYINEYYRENSLPEVQRDARIASIRKAIRETGFYVHTYDELAFGIKTAWRNSRRCVMRSQWSTIQLVDRRDVKTGEEMLHACFEHMRIATNGGRIRPTMTVFPQKFPGSPGPRIWNPQLIRYAGYKMKDGTVIGDPSNVEITTRAIELGWTPLYGRWDILPLIVNADGGEPVWRDMPKDTILEVKISHPTLTWFEEMDLRWHDHPPVSYFALSVGGINYTAIPFSGWYLSTEVASRNLADEHRYNALPEIGRRMGLPMNNRALWKDRTVLELNQAVLHSFDKAKVTLVDHHSASDSFVAHYEKEIKTRGHCPADWVWLTPPFSSSATRIFHQEMYSYLIKPAILPFSEKPWETYWRSTGRPPQVVQDEPIKFDAPVKQDIQIAYATETGTAERYAQKVKRILRSRGHEVNEEVVELDDLNLAALPGVLLVVTSTFGEGDPPSGAKHFAEHLALPTDDAAHNSLKRFAVFGLGNSTYTKTYQAFPIAVDAGLAKTGARRIIPLGRGDDASDNLEATFDFWANSIAVAIEVGTESVAASAESSEDAADSFTTHLRALRSFTEYEVTKGKALFTNGQHGEARRATYHIELAATDGTPIDYAAGDYLALLPVCDEQAACFAAQQLRIQNNETSTTLLQFVDYKASAPPALLELAGTASGSTIMEALAHINLSTRPINKVLQTLPLLIPRYFSIASAPTAHPTRVHLTVAELFGGRVSTALAGTISSPSAAPLRLRGQVRHSKFRLPVDPHTPLLLVGAGTGVAPLRGLLLERATLCDGGADDPDSEGSANGHDHTGAVLCLLGFRTPAEHLYAGEVPFARAEPAYSRASKPLRVGDLVHRHAEGIVRMLAANGAVRVCGSHAVGRDVEAALVEVCAHARGARPEEARAYVTKLKREGRILFDTYSHVATAVAA